MSGHLGYGLHSDEIINRLAMDYPNAEISIWTQVMLVLSLCVVLISTVNYLLQDDQKQDIKTIFIGLGMMVWSLVLHIYARFGGFDFEGAIWLCAVISIVGGANGLAVLKLLRFLIYKKIKRKWKMTI